MATEQHYSTETSVRMGMFGTTAIQYGSHIEHLSNWGAEYLILFNFNTFKFK